MKIIHRAAALGLTGALALTLLAGCGASGAGSSSASSEAESAAPAATEAPAEPTAEPAADAGTGDAAPAESGGHVLVVYYSATGNTAAVAQTIAETTGGDLFEITPAQPYTDDDLNWTDENSRVSQEYADESLRSVELATTTPDNWDSYDTVFIGYPIWWGIAAWPTSSFVEANDFTGKTVIPFCTSSSSGLGDSGTLLADAAGTGDWLEGERFRSGASAEDVAAWVEGLGL